MAKHWGPWALTKLLDKKSPWAMTLGADEALGQAEPPRVAPSNTKMHLEPLGADEALGQEDKALLSVDESRHHKAPDALVPLRTKLVPTSPWAGMNLSS